MIDEDSIETTIDTYNPHQIVTYKVIKGEYPNEYSEFQSAKVTSIEGYLDEGRKAVEALEFKRQELSTYRNQQASKIDSLREHILEEWQRVEDNEKESLRWIADLFDISLERTISFTARVEVRGDFRAEIDFSIDDLSWEVEQGISIDGNRDVIIDNYEVIRVNEIDG